MPHSNAILVFEPHAGSMKRTVSLVEQAGYEAVAADTIERATAALAGDGLQALLIAHTPSGVELGQYVRAYTDIVAPIAAIVGQRAADPRAAAEEIGADGLLRRPLTTGALETFLSSIGRLTELSSQVRRLQAANAELEGKLQRASLTSTRTGFHNFEAVKDLLVVEVRRAKRYAYPLAVLMVGLDPVAAIAEIDRPSLPREITAGLAVAIAKSIRVIDLPIHYADDRILVFLPHTDLAGAEEVGRRIKRRIKRITYRGENVTVQLTASVGVAGFSPGEGLTFSKLIKNATNALKAAQLKGGDRVMKRYAKSSSTPIQ